MRRTRATGQHGFSESILNNKARSFLDQGVVFEAPHPRDTIDASDTHRRAAATDELGSLHHTLAVDEPNAPDDADRFACRSRKAVHEGGARDVTGEQPSIPATLPIPLKRRDDQRGSNER